MAYHFNMWHAQSQALKHKPKDTNHPVHSSGCSYTSTSEKEVLQKGLNDSHFQLLSPGSAPISDGSHLPGTTIHIPYSNPALPQTSTIAT